MRLLILPPADDAKFSTALRAPVDAVIVNAGRSDAAQKCAAARAARKILGLEVPALSEPDCDAGLAAALTQYPDFVLTPKIFRRADLQHFGAKLAVFEARLGRSDGATKILAQIAPEPEAIFALERLGGPMRRLIGLVHDEPALAARLGLRPDDHHQAPLVYARAKILLSAACAQIPCWIDLRRGANAALPGVCASENFSGALIEDPDQAAPTRKIFDPVRNG